MSRTTAWVWLDENNNIRHAATQRFINQYNSRGWKCRKATKEEFIRHHSPDELIDKCGGKLRPHDQIVCENGTIRVSSLSDWGGKRDGAGRNSILNPKRKISISIAPDLLEWIDQMAKDRGTSRSEMIAIAIRNLTKNI